METTGGSIYGEKYQNNKQLIENVFQDDVAFTNDIYMWELNIKNIEEAQSINLRLYERKFSAANGTTVKFQSLHDTPVNIGDILYIKSENEYWICTESFNIDDIHFQGKLTLCNWILKWQNKQGDILQYPCYVINVTQYNSGETYGKNITIGSAQHQITLPADENTIIISTPQRFYLDRNKINPVTYIVTQNDTVTYNYGEKGLVKVSVVQDVADKSKDRPDLGICDYIENNIDNKQDNIIENDNKYIAYINYKTLKIKSGGIAQKYTAIFYDRQGNKIDNIFPSWKIISEFENELDINITDNSIIIKIDNDDYIDEEFKLILTDINNQVLEDSVIIKIESLL
jgi:hypothetical protein